MSIAEQLIEIVKEYPILYDLDHEDYKNLRKKDKIWDEIGAELSENREQLKKKWKNLRDSYTKHIKNLNTGHSAVKNSYKNWQWAQQMEHFKPFLMFSTTSTSVVNMDDSQLTSDTENTETRAQLLSDEPEILLSEEPEIYQPDTDISEVAVQFAPKEKERNRRYEHKNKKKKYFQNSDREGSSVKTVLNYLENRRETKKDPIDLIFQGYAEILKQFSPRRQAETKLKIAQIMTQQELQHQEELLLQKSQENQFPHESQIGAIQ